MAGAFAIVLVAVVAWFFFSGKAPASSDYDTSAWKAGDNAFTRIDIQTDGDCEDESYGQVQTYLQEHPCVNLARGAYEAIDVTGAHARVSVSWVTMPSEDEAGELLAKADTPNTGNVKELGGTFTGKHYKSRQVGNTAVIAQAEPVVGEGDHGRLVEIAGQALDAQQP